MESIEASCGCSFRLCNRRVQTVYFRDGSSQEVWDEGRLRDPEVMFGPRITGSGQFFEVGFGDMPGNTRRQSSGSESYYYEEDSEQEIIPPRRGQRAREQREDTHTNRRVFTSPTNRYSRLPQGRNRNGPSPADHGRRAPLNRPAREELPHHGGGRGHQGGQFAQNVPPRCGVPLRAPAAAAEVGHNQLSLARWITLFLENLRLFDLRRIQAADVILLIVLLTTMSRGYVLEAVWCIALVGAAMLVLMRASCYYREVHRRRM